MPSEDIARTDHEKRTSNLSRRRWLKALGIAGVAGLAGCGGGGDGTTTQQTTAPGDTATETDTPTPTAAEGFGTETDQTTTTTEVEQLPKVTGSYAQAVSSSFNSFNPLYNTEATTGTMIQYTSAGSYRFKPGQIQFPQFLELTSEDNKVWTAKLRENLRWSDPYGQQTAEDWVYNIKKIHQTDWAGTAASSDWYMNKKPIPVEKTGKYTFEITLPKADPLFPKKPVMWGHQVVPKKLVKPYVEKQDAKGLKNEKKLVNLDYTGNLGPYKLKKWQRQKKLVYERNDEYFMREADDVGNLWAEAPYWEDMTVQIIKEESSRLGALKTGEIDEAGIPPNKAANFKDREDVYLNVAPQPYNRPLIYNMRANGWKPFRKQGVRQALGCAIDKKKYVKGVYRGYAAPEYTWQPKWSPWYDAEKVVKYGTGDLYGPTVTRNKMKKALSDTDYGYSGDKLMNPDGEQVELDIYYQSSQQVEVNTAQFIKQEFKKNAGIKVNLNGIGATTFVRNYWQTSLPEDTKPSEVKWSKGQYNAGPRDIATGKKPWDMALVYGLNTYPMTPTTSEVFFKKDSYYNPYGYYPTYNFDKLFEKAKNAKTKAKAKKILADIFGKISKDQPMGMLALESSITGYRTGIVGPEEEFFNGWNFPNWHRKSQER